MMQSRKIAADTSLQNIKESAKSLAYAALLALLIRFLLFSPFVIPSGSMIPTLLVGDYLFVSCFSFGYSKYTIPFGYKLPGLRGRLFDFQKPKRGDVVVFRPTSNPKMDYVKRLVGMPGDTVQMKEGVLYINGQAATLRKIGPYEKRADEGGRVVKGILYEETLPGGVKHPIVKQQPFGSCVFDNTPVYRVPLNHYFVVGDNRDGSLDSRALHAIGYIPYDTLIGKPWIIFFSTDGRAAWWMFWKWPVATRFARFFNLIS